MSDKHLDSIYEAFTRLERRELLATLANTKRKIVLEPSEMTERIWIELYHIHLPKLEDAGLIYWNPEDHVITQGPRFEEVQPLFKVMHDILDRPVNY